MYTVPNAPEPSTLIFLNSVSFKILKRAWLGASPLGVRGSTSCERQGRRSTWRRLTQRTRLAYLKEEMHTFSKNLTEGMLTKGLPGTGVLEQNNSISTNESSLSSQLAGLREFGEEDFYRVSHFGGLLGPLTHKCLHALSCWVSLLPGTLASDTLLDTGCRLRNHSSEPQTQLEKQQHCIDDGIFQSNISTMCLHRNQQTPTHKPFCAHTCKLCVTQDCVTHGFVPSCETHLTPELYQIISNGTFRDSSCFFHHKK